MGADEEVGDKHSGAGREWGRWHTAMVPLIYTTFFAFFSLGWAVVIPGLWFLIGCAVMFQELLLALREVDLTGGI